MNILSLKTKTKKGGIMKDPNKVNPYREGSNYHAVLDYCKKKQVVTREGLVEAGFSKYDVNVVLSPTFTSKRGDCRGNRSAQGWNHYFSRLGRKIEKGIKSPNRYQFHWRKNVLEPRKRHEDLSIASEKVEVKSKIESVEKFKARKVAKAKAQTQTVAVDAVNK